jgi:hypothetical protein
MTTTGAGSAMPPAIGGSSMPEIYGDSAQRTEGRAQPHGWIRSRNYAGGPESQARFTPFPFATLFASRGIRWRSNAIVLRQLEICARATKDGAADQDLGQHVKIGRQKLELGGTQIRSELKFATSAA